MECAGHVMSHSPYVGIYECEANMKVCRQSGSSSSEIGPSIPQMMSFIAVEVTGVSGVDTAGEDKSITLKNIS